MGRLREKAWELEAKLPKAVKCHTDKAIRLGTRLRRGSKNSGEKWLKRQRSKLHI